MKGVVEKRENAGVNLVVNIFSSQVAQGDVKVSFW
jgi:hypothetical protein